MFLNIVPKKGTFLEKHCPLLLPYIFETLELINFWIQK